MPEESADRLERIVRDLLRGRRLRLRPDDSAEREAVMAAARLAAARQGYPRMRPGFRRQLAAQLAEPARLGWISRRAALVAGLGVAAGTLAGIGIGRGVQVSTPMRVSPPPQSPPPTVELDNYIEPRRPVWTAVARLAELSEGQAVKVKAGSVGAYLVRRGDQVTAVSSICSHLPCELEWRSSNEDLSCPCHNVAFKTDGQPANAGYQLQPLSQVRVRVVEGQVEVLGT
jgi:cytochrome b6-f complex iron-sulfur subunit